MRLSDSKRNINLKVVSINIKNNKLKQYLMDQGLVKDTIISIYKKSFFNGPIILKIRGFYLIISKSHAKDIEVIKL